jgi:Xaa-Pro aminopeptidase
MSSFLRRRDALRRLLREQKLDSLLVTDERNVTYLTGFTGDSSYLLVTPEQELLLTDDRYTEQLGQECRGLPLEVRGPGKKITDFAADIVASWQLPSLAIEAESVTLRFGEKLREAVKGSRLVGTSYLVESLREVKDEGEITEIREAIQVAERAFAVIRASLRPGRTEKEVADELEYQLRLFGGTCGAFPAIVGVGSRAALPHGRPSAAARIGDDDFVLIDWGARGRLYHSDLTRVLVTGKLSPQLASVYGVVLSAQKAAIAAIHAGAVMKEVDQAARRVIDGAGFEGHFGHATGHGIGLEIHEAPRLGPGEDRRLLAGMVVTVEPGVYLPGWGGVRIEDDVLVTEDGHEVLSTVRKELDECVC